MSVYLEFGRELTTIGRLGSKEAYKVSFSILYIKNILLAPCQPLIAREGCVAYLLNGAAYHKTDCCYLLCLAKSVNSGKCLLFYGWIPLWLQQVCP